MRIFNSMKLAACLLGGALALAAFQANPAPSQAGKAPDPADKSKDQAKLASLEGRVVNAISGDALRKVTLILTRTRATVAPTTTETDDKGQFSFSNLEPGRYFLFAERTGFARQAYGARSNSLVGTALLFSAGQQIKEFTFKLSPNAVIAGKVLDEDGDPIPNVAVMALKTVYQRGKKQFAPSGGVGMTNDVGEYRIANLVAGRYIVSATFRNIGMGLAGASNKPPGDKPEQTYTTTFYPNARDPVGASPVQVGVGAELRGTDIHMARVDTFRVRGKLGELPQGKTIIMLLTPKGAGVTGLITRSMGLAQQDGTFEIKGVPPGSYLLNATMDGMNMIGTTQAVEVTDQHLQGLMMQAASSGELPGTVTVEGKDPVNWKDIKIGLSSLEILSLSPPQTTVGEDGKFTLKSVPPDRYLVQTPNGPEALYIKSVRFGTQDVTEEGVDLTAGVKGSLEVTLSQNGAQVDGSVLGEDGNPLGGATVVLVPASRKFSLFKDMVTDQRGAFSFKGVAPGEYKLLAWEDIETGAFQDPEFLKPFEGKAENLTLKENDRRTVSFKALSVENSRRER